MAKFLVLSKLEKTIILYHKKPMANLRTLRILRLYYKTSNNTLIKFTLRLESININLSKKFFENKDSQNYLLFP